MSKIRTKEQFVAKANIVHKNKYNYDKFIFIDSKTKGIIGCPGHGDFSQSSNAHLSPSGCPDCNPKKLRTVDEFIKRANVVHNNKYDYSKFLYINSQTNGIIVCPGHGDFDQTPCHHLAGGGCNECAFISSNKKRTHNIDIFIEKANKIHHNKYDYSKFIYVNSYTKGIVICPKHDEFEALPSNHIKGVGCPGCKGDKLSSDRISNVENFIVSANEVHHNRYDYSKFIYTGANKVGIIGCFTHGDFPQTPSAHTSGAGCPDCANEENGRKCRLTKEEFLDKAHSVHGDLYDYSRFEYVSAHIKGIIGCYDHGDFPQSPANHLAGKGCPQCIYKNQAIVAEYLKDHNIIFETKAIRIDGRKYIPDFYLPDYKTMIEYNGTQHYQPVKFGSLKDEEANTAFIKQQKRDDIVKLYCLDNGIYFEPIDGRTIHGKEKIIKYLDELFKRLNNEKDKK